MTENEHGWQVFHCASIAATFAGWYFVSLTPRRPPKNIASASAGNNTRTASRADLPNTSGLELRRRCQAEIPSMTAAAVTSDAMSTWK